MAGVGKRKDHPESLTSKERDVNKRARTFPPRAKPRIASVSTASAYPQDEINAARFVRAHEAEIATLEASIKAAKRGQMRRAFQDVPRAMRRRTASHNPRRVPARLRPRVKKEMASHNTPLRRDKSGSGMGKGSLGWLRKDGVKRKKRARAKREARGKESHATAGVKDASDSAAKMAKDTGGSPSSTAADVDPEGPGTAVDDGADATVVEDSDQLMELSPEVEAKSKGGKTARDEPHRSEKRKKSKAFASLAKPPLPPAKFRKRQVDKSWLPTHLFHTKRAHMTPPKEPLWRFAIPLTPTDKCYRLTHRAGTLRGVVAFDASYVATIGLEGREASIVGLLKALHIGSGLKRYLWEDVPKGKKWRAGLRVGRGWAFERDSQPQKSIAPVTMIWSTKDERQSQPAARRAFVRVHPSAFLQLWEQVVRAAKVQKPSVSVEDLRFEIGSIEAVGPLATEALCAALSPVHASVPDSPEQVWKSMSGVSNLGTLPANALLAFSVSDPRLRCPPQPASGLHRIPSPSESVQMLAQWPVDGSHTMPAIFSRDARLAAAQALPSQRCVDRRKGAAPPGDFPLPESTDPQIPILAYTSQADNSWTVLLPWKCVDPVWRYLMRYPLSTGGNPRFGGLEQRRQLLFEYSHPWFPGDFPGTEAGWTWEQQQRVAREKEWKKRPKGKRVEWESVKLGDGRKGEVGAPWACDWEKLLGIVSEPVHADKEGKARFGRNAFIVLNQCLGLRFQQLPSAAAALLKQDRRSPVPPEYLKTPHLVLARITMVGSGVLSDCARVYRLPTTNETLRQKWLALLVSSRTQPASRDTSTRDVLDPKKPSSAFSPTQLEHHAGSPLPPADAPALQPSHAEYPSAPEETDLIGFVTTGAFNLADGKVAAFASLAVCQAFRRGVSPSQPDGEAEGKKKVPLVCIVRQAGQSVGRIARWEVVV